MTEPAGVSLSIVEGVVHVAGGSSLQNRQARLFFRSVLGATATEEGWSCPARGRTPQQLVITIHDWLDRQGYSVSRTGHAAQAIELTLERRRSFARTREAAVAFKEGHMPPELPLLGPTLDNIGWSDQRELRAHQVAGVSHALTAVNSANFSVPGSGKTVTALAAAAVHLATDTVDLVVVVGPLACFDPWEQESRAALGTVLRPIRVRGSARQRSLAYDQADRGHLLLLSYPTAAADLRQLTELFVSYRVMLIVDESHRVKRFRGGVWAPALIDLARRARVRMILSGTPMPQSGRDLYTQLNILWPDGNLTGTRDAFAARVDGDFASVLRDVHPFVSRTAKATLGLPPYETHVHDVELVGTQAEIYELIEGQFRRQLADASNWQEQLDALRRGRPIRLLQAATNPDVFNQADAYYRLPALRERTPTLLERLAAYRDIETPAKSEAALDLLTDMAARGEKAVCWSNFVPNLDHFAGLVRERLGVACFQIDGRVPAGTDSLHEIEESERPADASTREGVIQRFLGSQGPAVLITNPASCSESISLHRSCHNAIYLDRTYDAALWLQSIDRIHRLGLPPDADVNVHVLRATLHGQPTIDHLVHDSLEAKDARMRALLEGSDLAPLNLSEDPAQDAEGDRRDLSALLHYLLGEDL